MFRLLLALGALLSAPAAGFFAASGPEGDPISHHGVAHSSYPPPEMHTLVIDASAMPGETGWFLVPVRASAPTWVNAEVRVRHQQPATGDGGAAIIVDLGGTTLAFGSVREAFHELEANARGEQVVCCQELYEPFSYGGRSSSSGGFGGFLEAGQVGWVGLAAVGWKEGSKLKITLTSEAPLSKGAAHAGEHVEAIDLLAEARQAGDNVRLGSQTLVGQPGTAALSFRPAVTGLVVAQYMAQGDAGARLALSAHGVAIDSAIEDLYGDVVSFGPDAIDVRLSDLREARMQPTLFGSPPPGYVRATLLYAELDVPIRGGYAYESFLEDQDW